MKPDRSGNLRALLWCTCLACLFGVAPGSHGAPPKASSGGETNAVPAEETVFPKSEFNEQGGKDPFFPNRVLTPTIKTNSITPSEASKYVQLNGLYGTVSRPLCTINGRPFEAGEEGEVVTSAGRLKVRCIEIRKDSVVVEIVNSRERKELHLRGGP